MFPCRSARGHTNDFRQHDRECRPCCYDLSRHTLLLARTNVDLKTLHERTGIKRDLLRYCIDREVISGLQVRAAKHRTGRAREFDDKTALLIVCAALLIETGLSPSKVREFFFALLAYQHPGVGPGSRALELLIERRLQGEAHLGDGTFMRLEIPKLALESNWRRIDMPNDDFRLAEPAVKVTLDLGAIHFRMMSIADR